MRNENKNTNQQCLNYRSKMKLIRFTILASIATIVLMACGSSKTNDASNSTTKPNVLFIAVDDLRPELGCYDSTIIKSPNIDKLALRGVTFSNTFCNIPVCGASRASLMTGMRPTRNRFIVYSARADKQAPSAVVLSQYFKNNGYYTVANGKIFHEFEDNAQSWDENWRLQINDSTYHDYILMENKLLEGEESGPAFECADVPDSAYHDGKTALKTIADLKRLKDTGKPFFVAAGFVKPHLPFNAPKKYWNLYSPSDFKDKASEFWPENAPKQAFMNSGELRTYHGIPKSGPIGNDLEITLQHAYYASVSYTDANVGLLLNALDELGLRKNTIVVLWGDHGWNLGEHAIWGKHNSFKTALSAPLIISAPNMEIGKCASLAEFIDIYPTLTELCNLPTPSNLEGKSLVEVLKNPNAKHKDFVISKWKDGVTINTERYAYTEWRKDDDVLSASMLYDLYNDPAQSNNTVNNPENKALVDSLQTLLLNNRGADFFKPNY